MANYFIYYSFIWESTSSKILSFSQLSFTLQAFFYSLNVLSHWFPLLEKWIFLWWLFPIHGMIWMLALLTPSNSTPNALNEIYHGSFPFVGLGTWRILIFPIVYFWIYVIIRIRRFGLIYFEFSTPSDRPRGSHVLTSMLFYFVFSPAIPVFIWEWVLKRQLIVGVLTTDWAYYPGIIWITLVCLVVNFVLAMFVAVSFVGYKDPIMWVVYLKKGIVFSNSELKPDLDADEVTILY